MSKHQVIILSQLPNKKRHRPVFLRIHQALTKKHLNLVADSFLMEIENILEQLIVVIKYAERVNSLSGSLESQQCSYRGLVTNDRSQMRLAPTQCLQLNIFPFQDFKIKFEPRPNGYLGLLIDNFI